MAARGEGVGWDFDGLEIVFAHQRKSRMKWLAVRPSSTSLSEQDFHDFHLPVPTDRCKRDQIRARFLFLTHLCHPSFPPQHRYVRSE
eukprot:9469938-Pyramimonas_sp.AAC.2